jgi:ATP synthase protein I
MTDQGQDPGGDALDALSRRVAEARGSSLQAERAPADRSGLSLGLRMASEFASGILVGGLLGYGIDHLAKTAPWGLLAGLVLGLAAGTLNLVRVARERAAAHPVDPNSPRPAGWDDEED